MCSMKRTVYVYEYVSEYVYDYKYEYKSVSVSEYKSNY